MNRPGLPLRLLAPVVLGLAAALAYLAALGWDQQRDLQPDGSETGPYEQWQVVGLAVVVVLLAVIGGRIGIPWLAALAISVSLTWSFAYDATHGPSDDGLWPIAAALILLGSALTTSLIAGLSRRRPPVPAAG